MTFYFSLQVIYFCCCSTQGQPIDLQGLGTFVKYGSEVLIGITPRKLTDLALKSGITVSELPTKTIASAKVGKDLLSLVRDSYDQLCRDLVRAHKDFRTRESRIEKDRLIHGTIIEQKQQEFDQAKKLYEKLLSIVTTLSECMGQEIPLLEVQLCKYKYISSSLVILFININSCFIYSYFIIVSNRIDREGRRRRESSADSMGR